MRALVLAPFDARELRRLRKLVEVDHESWMETGRLYDPEELARRVGRDGINILVVEADFVTEEVLEQREALRLVGVCRNGLNQVDMEAASRCGVPVIHTPGRNSRAVAELTLGLMLALARRIPEADRLVREGCWQDPAGPYISLRGRELSGKVLGIVGLGGIGREVASMASALGMKVIASDPFLPEKLAQRLGITLVPLDELLSRADFVSLHCPPLPGGEPLLDSAKIGYMKNGACLINTAEGGLVDVEALVSALESGRLGGAALDVFPLQPLPPSSPLTRLPNAVLTPHIGGATEETVQRHSRMVTSDILRFVEGHRPRHLANPEVWGRHHG